jgi:hypothetical protein
MTGAALAVFVETEKGKETPVKVKKSAAEIIDDAAAGLRNAEQKNG